MPQRTEHHNWSDYRRRARLFWCALLLGPVIVLLVATEWLLERHGVGGAGLAVGGMVADGVGHRLALAGIPLPALQPPLLSPAAVAARIAGFALPPMHVAEGLTPTGARA